MAARAKSSVAGGVEFFGLAPSSSSTKKARMSRRKRFGHRAASGPSKTVYFPAWIYNIVLGMLQKAEANDPRVYIYPYEYLGELLLGLQRQHPELVAALAAQQKKGSTGDGRKS